MKGILGGAVSILGCEQVRREKNIKGGFKMKKILKNQKGFSLVELLVALLIMAVIAAIAIGLLGGILDTTKASSDRETGKTIARQLQTYIQATNDVNLKMLPVASGVTKGNDLVESLTYIIKVEEGATDGTRVSSLSVPSGVTPKGYGTKLTGIPAASAVADPTIEVATVGPLMDPKNITPQNTKAYQGWKITVHASLMTVDCVPVEKAADALVTIN